MRKQILSLAVAAMALLFTTGLTAQITTPSASPTVKMETTVGLTDLHVEYSRPGVKGRKVFAADGLVPFGEVWRTGANQATKVTFGGKVMIGGTTLEGGSYAVLTKPMADMWEVMFFAHEGGNWGMYMEKTPVATVKVKPQPTTMTETFTIDVQNHTMNSADLILKWNKTMVAVQIETAVKEAVMANIEQVMAGPSMNDYYQAASFVADNGDKKQALEYINKAVEMGGETPRYWMVRRQGLILSDLGMKKEAMASFEKSMMLAEKAGNMDYVRMNKASMKKMK
jgi:predicted RNA polymerase sigma factor